MTKNIIREQILERLKSQSEEERKKKSQVIENKLFSSESFKKAHVVMLYVSKEEEVDTHHMVREALKAGKRVVVPYCISETNEIVPSELKDFDKDLQLGVYGIYQPKDKALREIPFGEIDLVVVPGIAFDKRNNRLGRGKGYYDKFLEKLSPGTEIIGICFNFQLLDYLPSDSFDFPVSKVISN